MLILGNLIGGSLRRSHLKLIRWRLDLDTYEMVINIIDHMHCQLLFYTFINLDKRYDY